MTFRPTIPALYDACARRIRPYAPRSRSVAQQERRRDLAAARRLRACPVARLLIVIDPTLTDAELRSGIASARRRALGWLRGRT